MITSGILTVDESTNINNSKPNKPTTTSQKTTATNVAERVVYDSLDSSPVVEKNHDKSQSSDKNNQLQSRGGDRNNKSVPHDNISGEKTKTGGYIMKTVAMTTMSKASPKASLEKRVLHSDETKR
jgi:predicted transcriptional regulator